MPDELLLILVAAVVPASLLRLWWIWWNSDCHGCGFDHRACVCPANDHLMRPRR